MAQRVRNYAAEYQRRLARGLSKGLSRSQARGHPRIGEQHINPPRRVAYDRTLEAGLNVIRRGQSLTSAARALKVSPERLRSYVKALPFVEKRGRRFRVGEDPRPRRVEFYADGRRVVTIVLGYEPAAIAGSYWDAVHRGFLPNNEPAYLAPFVGVHITDANGRSYTLETRPNVLYRLANEGGEPFEQIYALTL